jgi:hypothetical protein
VTDTTPTLQERAREIAAGLPDSVRAFMRRLSHLGRVEGQQYALAMDDAFRAYGLLGAYSYNGPCAVSGSMTDLGRAVAAVLAEGGAA